MFFCKLKILGVLLLLAAAMPALADAVSIKPLRLTKSLQGLANVAPNQSKLPAEKNSRYLQTSAAFCQTFNAENPLTLNDVLAHAVCKNPSIVQALNSIDEQQAGIDLADSAFNPRLSANAELASNRFPSNNNNAGSLGLSATGSINLSWMLFDFGVRDANLLQAKHRLNAALFTRDNTTLTTLTDALRIYTEALNAFGKLHAISESEVTANKSLAIATARYEAKVGGLSEKLQAETALAEAALERSRAQGNWLNARGVLAVAMGLQVQTPIALANVAAAFPNIERAPQLEEVLAEASSAHPRIRNIGAEIDALQARLSAIKSEDKGSISLSSNAAATSALNNDSGNNINRNFNISVQANIPLLNDKEQNARQAQIAAQIAGRQAQLEVIQRELANEIWKNGQQIATESDNQQAAERLVAFAAHNYEISLGRYQSSVGTILDVLTAQTTLAKAKEKLQEAHIAYIKARIALSLAAGRLSHTKTE